jgi:hypothetical protein
MYIVPRPGLKIRDPISRQIIPETGKKVTDNLMFWHRIISDGDVTIEPSPEDKGDTE